MSGFVVCLFLPPSSLCYSLSLCELLRQSGHGLRFPVDFAQPGQATSSPFPEFRLGVSTSRARWDTYFEKGQMSGEAPTWSSGSWCCSWWILEVQASQMLRVRPSWQKWLWRFLTKPNTLWFRVMVICEYVWPHPFCVGAWWYFKKPL